MNKDILDLGKETIGKTAKGLQTINRFIKLFNSMPEEVQQKFYCKMATKITEDTSELKSYHVHVYKISGKVEIDNLSFSEKEAKERTLELAERGVFIFEESDCKYIALAFLEKKPDYSGAKITHRPPDRKPADLYDKK